MHPIKNYSGPSSPAISSMHCWEATTCQLIAHAPTCLAFEQRHLADAINPKIYMKQQILDLSIDHTQPLVHCVEFYDSNHAIQAIWTRRSFKRFIKKNYSFFGDTVISLRSGVFLRGSFLGRLNEWLLANNQTIDVNKYSEK